MLNTIFIVWLFRIEGAGNLHLPVAKINLYYGDKGEKGGIVRTTMMETVFIMSTMILLNSIFTVRLFWSEGAGNLSSLFWGSHGEVPTKSRCEIIKRVRATRKNVTYGHVRDGALGLSRAPQTRWMEEPSTHACMYVFDVHLFENFERVFTKTIKKWRIRVWTFVFPKVFSR